LSAPSTSLEKSKIKVLLLEGIHQSAAAAFQGDGYTSVVRHPKSLPEDQLLEAAGDAYFIGIRSSTKLTARVFEHAKRLLSVGCFCIGTDQVDLEAARERGIPVFNAPFSNTRSVAELVVAEIILLLRGIPARNAAAHRGEWLKTASGSHEVRGKTLGIVGYGHIGTQVGLLAEGLGMRVIFHDIVTKLALGNARPLPSLAAVLDEADVLTLHVPETPQTFRMMGGAEIARMKRGSSLINAARGTVVDVDALAEALRPVTWRERRWTSSPGSPRPTERSSCLPCAGCPTSSSRRTWGAPPKRRRRASGWRWRRSSSSTATTGPP
jgi:D-3-phosphoglycerate dehydrogenase